MKTFDVPGMSVAIVKDGKVVLAKGYRVRKLGEPTPVDENTLFGIGSNTKAFTAAAVATLVDEGKLSWDDTVYERLKGFEMYDPYVSKEMRVRDLLCHRSGLGLGDLIFWPHTTFTRDVEVSKWDDLQLAVNFGMGIGLIVTGLESVCAGVGGVHAQGQEDLLVQIIVPGLAGVFGNNLSGGQEH